MPFTVERETKWVIYRDPEPGAVLERRSFVGECDSEDEALATVTELRSMQTLAEGVEG